MNTLEQAIEIFKNTRIHESRADKLFELIYKELNPRYTIPSNEELLKYGKQLKLDKLRFEDGLFQFTSYTSVGYADWTDAHYMSPFLFFWKVILPNEEELRVKFN